MEDDWTPQQEAENLARRFEGVNQAAFARAHGIPGGPSMLSQHIKGRRPMNLAAALAYSRGFLVPLKEISPRWARTIGAMADEARALPGELESARKSKDPAEERRVDTKVEEAIASMRAFKDAIAEGRKAVNQFPAIAEARIAVDMLAKSLATVATEDRERISRLLAGLALAPDSQQLIGAVRNAVAEAIAKGYTDDV